VHGQHTKGSVNNKKRHADDDAVDSPTSAVAEGSIESFGYAAAEMLARLGITDQVRRPA
jgi:hypothetical protein